MRSRLLLLLILAPFLPGCGTIVNLAGGAPVPYGGVATDVAFLMTPATPSFSSCSTSTNCSSSTAAGDLVLMGLWCADLCVSSVADTLTLPLILAWDKPTVDPPRVIGDDDPPPTPLASRVSAAAPAPSGK